MPPIEHAPAVQATAMRSAGSVQESNVCACDHDEDGDAPQPVEIRATPRDAGRPAARGLASRRAACAACSARERTHSGQRCAAGVNARDNVERDVLAQRIPHRAVLVARELDAPDRPAPDRRRPSMANSSRMAVKRCGSDCARSPVKLTRSPSIGCRALPGCAPGPRPCRPPWRPRAVPPARGPPRCLHR